MATLNKDELYKEIVHAGEYGSVSHLDRTFKSVTLSSGDVLHVARIPANSKLIDATLFHGAGGTAASVKFGYVPSDVSITGEDVDDYFLGTTVIATAGRKDSARIKAPVTVPYDVDLVITSVVTMPDAADLAVSVLYEWIGK